MLDKKNWITKIAPTLAFVAGIIITSVGGIMTISSSLKLAAFDSEPYSYISKESCYFDHKNPVAISGVNTIPSQVEIDECMSNQKKEELQRFQKNQQENIIDGISALIVGGILLLVFKKHTY